MTAALERLRPPAGADEHVWAARITACWRASVEAILEVGRLLTAAKDALPHGAFGSMIESELPFGSSTAQRLMAIAGDVRLSNPAHVQHLPASWGTLYELTKLPDDEFERKIADGTIRPDMMRRDLVPAKPVTPPPSPPAAQREASAPATLVTIEHDPHEPPHPGPEPEERDDAVIPYGHRSIMSSRREPDDSLDYFPTPPWATRSLIEYVLPRAGLRMPQQAWDPACGEGHMTGALEEYPMTVLGSDIFDYSVDGQMPPGWWKQANFLDDDAFGDGIPVVDWIIMNPPFGDNAEAFVLRALAIAKVGVAGFFRLQWLESNGRYERIFEPYPPAVIAQFAERVPLCKGKWDPTGSTATAYLWIVWHKSRPGPQRRGTEFIWIPPGQRAGLSRPDDCDRFLAHPVLSKPYVDPPSTVGGIPEEKMSTLIDGIADPETGEILADEITENPSTGGSHEDVGMVIPRDANPEAGEAYVVSAGDPASGSRSVTRDGFMEEDIPERFRRTAE